MATSRFLRRKRRSARSGEPSALLHRPAPLVVIDEPPPDWTLLAHIAADSGDEHRVKLTEAARRGLAATGDHIFAAAARVATGTHARG